MTRRLVSILLPAAALCANVAGARMPPVAGNTVIVPAQADAERAAAALDHMPPPGDNGFSVIPDNAGAPASDLGLAGAALANGPVTVGPAGRRATAVTAKPKSRLPEPATWVMLIGGMYGIGAVLRRRHRASEAAFTARIRAIAASEDEQDRA